MRSLALLGLLMATTASAGDVVPTTDPVIICEWCMVGTPGEDFGDGVDDMCQASPTHPGCSDGGHIGYLVDPVWDVYMQYQYDRQNGNTGNIRTGWWMPRVVSVDCAWLQVCDISSTALPY